MPAELRSDDEPELAADEEVDLPDDDRSDRGPRRLGPSEIGFAPRAIRTSRDERRLSRLVGVVAVLVAVAIVKPWPTTTGDGPTPGPRLAAVPSPTPTPRPTEDSPEGLAGPVCMGAGAWRIASLETWRERDVRVWRAIEPIAEATGPLDPAIPTVPVAGEVVRGLGWCAPAYGPEEPAGPARVHAWFVVDGVARDLPLRQVLPERGTTHLAAIYVPASSTPGGAWAVSPSGIPLECEPSAICPPVGSTIRVRGWTTGRVVFRYVDLGAVGGSSAWFGVDVLVYPPTEPAEPSAAPASDGGEG